MKKERKLKYPDDFINKIICGDCLEEMKKLPANSIDTILTDPPYNIDISKYKNLVLKTKKGQRVLHDGGEKNRKYWDKGKCFHYEERFKWDKKEQFDIHKMSKILFSEFDRLLKETGTLIIFGAQEWAYHYYKPAIDNNFHFKSQIIWIKSNPIPQIRKKNYRSAHENIIWFARYNEKKVPFTFNFITQQEMKNIFEYPILGGNERWQHPTQKPLELIKKLVLIHSNKNDLVLDPFMGSGTTCVACKELNRKYIGIEIDKKYFNIAKKRLAQEILL